MRRHPLRRSDLAVLTGLAPDPRQPGYRLVEVDRGRFASLPAADLELLSLAIGREIPVPALERLQELADIEAAWRAALRSQRQRGHARQDLRRRLVRKQHPPAAVDVALERLAERGLLAQDDNRARLLETTFLDNEGAGVVILSAAGAKDLDIFAP